jgi:hypothetical protein
VIDSISGGGTLLAGVREAGWVGPRYIYGARMAEVLRIHLMCH